MTNDLLDFFGETLPAENIEKIRHIREVDARRNEALKNPVLLRVETELHKLLSPLILRYNKRGIYDAAGYKTETYLVRWANQLNESGFSVNISENFSLVYPTRDMPDVCCVHELGEVEDRGPCGIECMTIENNMRILRQGRSIVEFDPYQATHPKESEPLIHPHWRIPHLRGFDSYYGEKDTDLMPWEIMQKYNIGELFATLDTTLRKLKSAEFEMKLNSV